MNNVFHTIFTYSNIQHTFYDPINKKLGFFKFCPPDMCVQNSGRLFWCMQWVIMTDVAEIQYNCGLPWPIYYSRLSWCMWWKSLAKTNDSDFFLFNWPLYWASTMHTMIKYHCTEQQSYAIMVAHHIHYDNPPLYHTHFMEVPGFNIFSQQTLANQLTQQVSAIMVLLFLPHKVLESQLTPKRRDL